MMIKSSKAARQRRYQESKVAKAVRAECVNRDGDCRLALTEDSDPFTLDAFGACSGESEWAHLENGRRFKTQRMAPELRHNTATSAILCTRHHDAYDKRKTLRVTLLSSAGANGELLFRTRNGDALTR